MFVRIVKHFITPVVLAGFGAWAMNVGLPITKVLTPFWGWVLTVSGFVAVLAAIPLSIRGVSVLKNENREIESRRPSIVELRSALSQIETQIDDVYAAVDGVPLSEYEARYLSKIDGYQGFKKKYITDNKATDGDAQYVALGINYKVSTNPLFSDSLKSSPAQVTLNTIADLEQRLPDSHIRSLIELLIDVKKKQSVSMIDHKLNPAKWNAYVSDMRREIDVELEFDRSLRKVRREVNRRLTQLENGAKYE